MPHENKSAPLRADAPAVAEGVAEEFDIQSARAHGFPTWQAAGVVPPKDLKPMAREWEGRNQVNACLTNGNPWEGRLVRINPLGVVVALSGVLPPLLAEGAKVTQITVAMGSKTSNHPQGVIRTIRENEGIHLLELALEADWWKQDLVSPQPLPLDQWAAKIVAPVRDWTRMDEILVDPAFKELVADCATFLSNVEERLDPATWELDLGQATNQDRMRQAAALLQEIQPLLDKKFGVFEQFPTDSDPQVAAACHMHVRALLHPYLLSSPFVDRVYDKPLGFAGDYRMLEMLLGEPFIGKNLLGKIISGWLIRSEAGAAYRARIRNLEAALQSEAFRCRKASRPCGY
jgi:hypothetical protein